MKREAMTATVKDTTVVTQLEVIPARQQSLVARQATQPLEGLEGLGTDDLVIPRWSVCQPTSQMDGGTEHVGQWFRNIDGEFRKVLECVILAIMPSRVKFPFGSAKGAPECVSRDRVTGSVHGACATCQYNWKANAAMRAAKAAGEDVDECHDGYTMLIVDDAEALTPAIIGFKSTAVRPVQILYTQLKFQRKASPYHCPTRIELSLQTNKQGKYFVPKFVLGEPFDPDNLGKWKEAYRLLSAVAKREESWTPAEDVEPTTFNAESLNDPRAVSDDF